MIDDRLFNHESMKDENTKGNGNKQVCNSKNASSVDKAASSPPHSKRPLLIPPFLSCFRYFVFS